MYKDYTQKKLNCQEKKCTLHSRCHNYKTCKICNKIFRQKNYSIATKTLSDTILSNYKSKHYLVITSNDVNISLSEKNSYIDLFLKDFLIMKRNKNFFINSDTEFFITKEISYTKKLNQYNPHLNIILLDTQKLDFQNKQLQKILKKYNLKLHNSIIKKSNNSILTSIKKIINYSLKFDKDRANLERTNNISKYKRNVFKSALFLGNTSNLQRRLYIHIKDVKKHYSKKINEAKKIFKKNISKKHIKNYIRLLKSLRKKKNYFNCVKNRKIKRLKSKIIRLI